MKNFAGLKGVFTDYNESKFFVLPVPYSTQNDWNPMASRAPEAIVEASQRLELYETEILDLEKVPVVLGGNRTVSIGSARAACNKYDNLTVIQFGAHNAMRVNYKGSEYSPECAMYHIKKLAPLVQIGIRSMGADGQRNVDLAKIFFARDIFFDNNHRWLNEMYDVLTENVYITLDMDVLDPSVMPSVSLPEPGGMEYFMLLRTLKEIFRRSNVIGLDVIGLCPDSNNVAPTYLTARLVYQIMTYKAVYSYGL